jgi:hypothetical protein
MGIGYKLYIARCQEIVSLLEIFLEVFDSDPWLP